MRSLRKGRSPLEWLQRVRIEALVGNSSDSLRYTKAESAHINFSLILTSRAILALWPLIEGDIEGECVFHVCWVNYPGSDAPLLWADRWEGDPSPQFCVNMGNDEAVGPWHRRRVGPAPTADMDGSRSGVSSDFQRFSDAFDFSPDRRGVGGVPGEYKGVVVVEPAQHFFIGSATDEQPLAAGDLPEVCLIVSQVPWDACAGGDKPVC
ncbi:MAG: hypothetical protein R3F13_09505 [Prosthecobacter sp.]